MITSDTYTALFSDLDRVVTDGGANIIHMNRRKPQITDVRTKLKRTTRLKAA